MKQEDFYKAANEWHNIFLTWVWWSWKSYALDKWKNENKHLRIVTVAPTGIAAINVWWSTIHSAFKLPFGLKFFWVTKQKIPWSWKTVLIIDEISMVWVWIMDQIDKTLRAHKDDTKPFWWIQMIVVWDNAQLPPIIMDYVEREEIISEHWWVEFFHSIAYKSWNFKTINLTENKRSHDDKLNNALNKIRENEFDINDFQVGWYSWHFSNRAIHLMWYNAQVDSFNQEKLIKLPWKQQKFNATITWNFNVKNVLSPSELTLKIDATVMITKNLEIGLVNWDMWTIVEIWDTYVKFLSFRKDIIFTIPYVIWEDTKYDETWFQTVVWTFSQIPLRLWWAITIHKSQWLTLERVVFHFNERMDNASIYVGLSRAVTWENLYINI